MERLCGVWQGVVRQGSVWHGFIFRNHFIDFVVRFGDVRRGMMRSGLARFREARRGEVMSGEVVYGNGGVWIK